MYHHDSVTRMQRDQPGLHPAVTAMTVTGSPTEPSRPLPDQGRPAGVHNAGGHDGRGGRGTAAACDSGSEGAPGPLAGPGPSAGRQHRRPYPPAQHLVLGRLGGPGPGRHNGNGFRVTDGVLRVGWLHHTDPLGPAHWRTNFKK